MRSDPSISGGFRLLLPAGMTVKLIFMKPSIRGQVSPFRSARSTSPFFCSSLKNRDVEGWRRSASTSATFRPEAAAEIARLTANVVLPSPGRDEVTWITLGGWSTSDMWILLRKVRNASLNGESGCSTW